MSIGHTGISVKGTSMPSVTGYLSVDIPAQKESIEYPTSSRASRESGPHMSTSGSILPCSGIGKRLKRFLYNFLVVVGRMLDFRIYRVASTKTRQRSRSNTSFAAAVHIRVSKIESKSLCLESGVLQQTGTLAKYWCDTATPVLVFQAI